MEVQVNIINTSPHPLPHYATPQAAGMDLYAWLQAPVQLQPLERALIPTGLFIELPLNYEAQVRPRSGLAWKQGLTVLNSPGTIDADYRGEIKVILINLGNQVQTLQDGDRIAQLVVAPVQTIRWVPVSSIQASDRGQGGFGHTGK